MEYECGQVVEKFETKIPNPKLEILNPKQTRMSKTQNSKPYDLQNIRFNCWEVEIIF
jgi:hypothetical protein